MLFIRLMNTFNEDTLVFQMKKKETTTHESINDERMLDLQFVSFVISVFFYFTNENLFNKKEKKLSTETE